MINLNTKYENVVYYYTDAGRMIQLSGQQKLEQSGMKYMYKLNLPESYKILKKKKDKKTNNNIKQQ